MASLTRCLCPKGAIYYSLGHPAFIVPIVHETLQTGQNVEEPILNFLIEIEKTLHQLVQDPKTDKAKTMEHVNDIIEFASEIVELFGSESQ